MFSRNQRGVFSCALALAAAGFIAVPDHALAAIPDKGTTITYSASGTFTATQISGDDTLKMSGQPFTISIVGQTSMTPVQHGQNWAIFKPLSMTGTVYSGLIPNQAIPIASDTAAIDQTVGASEDIFQSGFPVVVIGISLTVRAHITMPGGTLVNALLRPFSSVALSSNATVTYSNGTASTVLGVQSGTLVATIPGGGPAAAILAPGAPVFMASLAALKPRTLAETWL